MRYGARYAGLPPDIINFQHDPLTCAVALGWDGVAVETRSTAAVLEGDWLRTRIDAGAPLRRIVARVDGPAFNQLWLDVVTERAV